MSTWGIKQLASRSRLRSPIGRKASRCRGPTESAHQRPRPGSRQRERRRSCVAYRLGTTLPGKAGRSGPPSHSRLSRSIAGRRALRQTLPRSVQGSHETGATAGSPPRLGLTPAAPAGGMVVRFGRVCSGRRSSAPARSRDTGRAGGRPIRYDALLGSCSRVSVSIPIWLEEFDRWAEVTSGRGRARSSKVRTASGVRRSGPSRLPSRRRPE
jgi:hypothetical protein